MPACGYYMVVLLATAMAFDAALGQGCTPPPQGYILRADTDWWVPLFSPLSVSQASPSTVGQQCSSKPNCLAYTSRGELLLGQPGTRVTYVPSRGLCTYVKDPNFKPATPACAPAKKGYTLKADTNWIRGSGNTESQTSPSAAEQQCNADANCVAWNSFGYIISGKRDSVSYTQYKGLCVYVKDAPQGTDCPSKAGYQTLPDANWYGNTNTKESQTSAENAARICKLDANCVAWNSYGYYILGKPSDIVYQPYKGLCVYVKKNLPITLGRH